jgi:hypothetical protein
MMLFALMDWVKSMERLSIFGFFRLSGFYSIPISGLQNGLGKPFDKNYIPQTTSKPRGPVV